MSIINLQNQRLRKYIRKKLDIEKYEEPYATLIEEVFVREQYILNLTPKEFLEDLSNFKEFIKKFEWGRYEPNCMAKTLPERKKITFNENYWQKVSERYTPGIYCKKFFEAFAHECLHGMQFKRAENGRIIHRSCSNDVNGKKRAQAIYEICTQGIAAKMSNQRRKEELENNDVLTGDGYSSEIFAIPLISATFGVSETEVLKYGVREREKLVEVLSQNIGSKERTRELLNKIENQLEYMHSIHFPSRNQIAYQKMKDSEKKRESSKIIINLVKICQEALAIRIKNTPLDFDKNMAIQYRDDQKKIIDTLRYEFQHYAYNFDQTYSKFIRTIENGENAKYIREAMNVFDQIGKDKTGTLIANSPLLILAVREGKFDICREKGIQTEEDESFSLVKNAIDFKQRKAHYDYNDFKAWDDRHIFEALYPNWKVENRAEENRTIPMLNNWRNRIYSEEGNKKYQNLKHAMTENKEKFGLESSQILLNLLETPEHEMDRFYNKFTISGEARKIFYENFRTIDDKEFLARLIAEKYIDRIFYEDGRSKELDVDREKEIQMALKQTIQNRGREQLVWAISQMLINDYYQGFSDEGARLWLSINGKKRIFDTISTPLLEELLNKRKIIPEKDKALQKAIYETEARYPQTITTRIVMLIKNYKEKRIINTNLIAGEGKESFQKYFRNQRDIEDLLGLFCNNFLKRFPFHAEGILKTEYEDFQQLVQIVQNVADVDVFRENMIKYILYDEPLKFCDEMQKELINKMPLENLIKALAIPYIQKSIVLENNRRFEEKDGKQAKVQPADLKPIVIKQRGSSLKEMLGSFFKNEKQDKSDKYR